MPQPDRPNRAVVLTERERQNALPSTLAARDLGRTVVRKFHQAARVEAERRAIFLLAPVCFGMGILLYFASEGEPRPFWSGFLSLAFAGLAIVVRAKPMACRCLLAFCLASAGFTASAVRTANVKRPVLERITIGKLEGTVLTMETRPGQTRVLLSVSKFAALPDERVPERVRVSLRDASAVRPGDTIRATVRLLPPPEPVRPGGYHFMRDAFFARIGAVGSILGKVEVVTGEQTSRWSTRAIAALDQERNRLNDRISAVYGGQAGAVAAALVTGKRGLIEEETNDAMRASGIYHIISISGLHMALASGAMFWAIRALLALSPWMALHWPIRKIAAVLAMAGGILYCVFSGANVATVRALLMTLIMLGAILIDRPAFSMRNLAIAALIVMALEPETILGPSFQMSFAAVAALIALYDRPRQDAQDSQWLDQERPKASPPNALPVLRYVRDAIAALVKTTLVASAATAPFAAYHFHTANPYSLIGNLFGLPFVSMIGMPSALAGAFLYPLGLDWPFWWVMGFSMDAVIWISQFIEALPTARTYLTAFAPSVLVMMTLALLFVTIARTWLRWLGAIPFMAGLALVSGGERPDILVDRQASGAAIRGSDGRYVIVGRPSSFVIEQWLAADGDIRAAEPKTAVAENCDRNGCIARLSDGRLVAFIRNVAAIPEDCARADIAILQVRGTTGCRAKLVIDQATLQQRGALAIYFSGEEVRFTGALDGSQGKSWTRAPPALRAGGATSSSQAPRPEEKIFNSDEPD